MATFPQVYKKHTLSGGGGGRGESVAKNVDSCIFSIFQPNFHGNF